MRGTNGQWNRGSSHDPFGHGRARSNPVAVVPELDPATSGSAIVLLLAVAMLRTRRDDERQPLLLAD